VEPSLSHTHTSFGSLTTQFCFDLERGESGADQCRLNSEICVDKEFNGDKNVSNSVQGSRKGKNARNNNVLAVFFSSTAAKRRRHHPVTSSSSGCCTAVPGPKKCYAFVMCVIV
uniref:Uncharacterized protein n=1 Tax=Anopheles atroparvus TaxID=41427 RepID=A0AAG5DQ51_ANOAO